MRHVRPRAAARHRAPPPEERSLSDPRYIGSFPRADVLLDPPLPEVAFVGRSNVGKSTLLNALVGRRIAKTSGTPGKTRALNVFLIDESHYFLDLPGYGYARSEEHTSELQSRQYLVCRLLLEKKKDSRNAIKE